MAENEQQRISMRGLSLQLQIPIFYKLMVSMLFVAMLPVLLLSIVSMGETQNLVSALGLQTVIFIITLVTLTIIMMWSFFLATHITKPIVQLSEIATSISKGELKTSEIQFMSNDEIGELITAFNKMINTYRILDTLAREETE
jgi:methyl-accepting chemotaxis protein